jgi:hypothetical protein
MNGRLPLYALLAGCVLFGALLFLELTAPGHVEPQPFAAAPRRALAPAPLRPPGENVQALLATTLARPLFSPTRRPSGKSDGGGATGGLGDSRLTGIITVPQHRIAIFAMPGAKPLVVSEGDTVSGWRIDSITPEEVSLTGPDGSKTLKPKADPALAVARVPPQPIMPGVSQPVPVRQLPPGLRPPLPRPGLPIMPPAFRPGQR